MKLSIKVLFETLSILFVIPIIMTLSIVIPTIMAIFATLSILVLFLTLSILVLFATLSIMAPSIITLNIT